MSYEAISPWLHLVQEFFSVLSPCILPLLPAVLAIPQEKES